MDKITEFIKQIAPRHRARKVKNDSVIIDYLDTLYPGVTLNMQISSLLSGISPLCKECNNQVKTLGKETCSVKCRELLKQKNSLYFIERNIKSKITCIEKFGVDNAAKNADIQLKRISTLEEKYGSKVSPKTRSAAKDRSAELNKKGRETLKKKYNVDNPGQIPGHYEMVKNTMNSRYNVDHYTKTPEYIDKSNIKRLEKYNIFSPAEISVNTVRTADNKLEIFTNPNNIIDFSCSTCNISDSIPSETFKWRIREAGTPCRKCSGISRGSLKENEIKEFIRSLGFDIQENQKLLNGLEIDIFIPEQNIGIEFHGLFWHNDMRIDKNYHKNKLDIATSKGIRLIQIFEDEWEHKKEIVKSRLSNMLGVNTNRIYGRLCIIKEITHVEEREFLNENHIQGYTRSSIKLGLYFENTLVSVMTFSRPNLSRGIRDATPTEWELLRFASLKDSNVLGAAGKLFKYFQNTYFPTKVTSYSDKRWSVGGLYKTIGFSTNGDTPINYWYIDLKNLKRLHRFSLRKNSKDNQSLTEYENRLAQGYLRIWDCGNSRWTWTNDITV